MSDLVSSVQCLLRDYVRSKEDTHVEIDVWRVLRDQSLLLYERQGVVDALSQHAAGDGDDDVGAAAVERLCRLLRVASCHRVVTREGLSLVDAAVAIRRGEAAGEAAAREHVQLWFRYERRPEEGGGEGTHVKYSIDVSRDHDRRHRILTVECWAAGNAPSMEPAVPLDGWDDSMEAEDEEEEDEMVGVKEESAMDGVKDENDKNGQGDGGETTENEEDDENDNADRYAAHMDPETVELFKEWTGLDMDEGPIFFLLMAFPFWEHEWDLVEFGLLSVFGDDDDDDDDVEVIEFDEEGDEVS